eukprot:scaffold1578_cov340-Prasinococcus_capsulatus_cf.AAC.1
MGNNSTNEALYMGCPFVCVPGTADQFANADRAASLGLGALIPSPWRPWPPQNLEHVTSAALRSRVEEVLSSAAVKAACAEMRTKYRTKHAYLQEQAVDDICAYVEEWRARAPPPGI